MQVQMQIQLQIHIQLQMFSKMGPYISLPGYPFSHIEICIKRVWTATAPDSNPDAGPDPGLDPDAGPGPEKDRLFLISFPIEI